MKPDVNGNVDEDRAILEQVLDTLYDFGNGSTQKKKKKKRCKQDSDPKDLTDFCNVNGDQREAQESSELTVQSQGTKHAAVKPLRQVEVVSFQDPAKRQKTKQMPILDTKNTVQTSEKKHSAPQQGLSLEKARLEVHRFGITGYKKEQQRVFEEERAVMLGARPAKKSYLNYKVMQQQIKEKKAANVELHRDLKKKKNPSKDNKKTTTSSSSSAPTGQVGRFKDGVLVLSPKEIKTIKSKMQRK